LGDEFRGQLRFCGAVETLQEMPAPWRLSLSLLCGEFLDLSGTKRQLEQLELSLERLSLLADMTHAISWQSLPVLKQAAQLEEFSGQLEVLGLERLGRFGKFL
jgi:hypothetical protein